MIKLSVRPIFIKAALIILACLVYLISISDLSDLEIREWHMEPDPAFEYREILNDSMPV